MSFNPHREVVTRLRLAVENVAAAASEAKVADDNEFAAEFVQLSCAIALQKAAYETKHQKQLLDK